MSFVDGLVQRPTFLENDILVEETKKAIYVTGSTSIIKKNKIGLGDTEGWWGWCYFPQSNKKGI